MVFVVGFSGFIEIHVAIAPSSISSIGIVYSNQCQSQWLMAAVDDGIMV